VLVSEYDIPAQAYQEKSEGGLKKYLRRYRLNSEMARKPDADPAASALAHKRWDAASDEDRSQEGKRLADARWAGHEAKRPASSRKQKVKAL